MWAMIPMFRVLASGYSRMTRPPLPGAPVCRSLVACAVCATSASNFLAGVAIAIATPWCHRWTWRPGGARIPLPSSPSVMRERAVGLGHLVQVLAPLHRGSLAAGRVHDLAHQALGHGVLPA